MSTINLNSEVAEQPPSQLQPKFGTVELAREIAKAWDNGASLPQYDFTYTSDDADLRGITDHESCETSAYSSDILLQEIAAHSEESEKSSRSPGNFSVIVLTVGFLNSNSDSNMWI